MVLQKLLVVGIESNISSGRYQIDILVLLDNYSNIQIKELHPGIYSNQGVASGHLLKSRSCILAFIQIKELHPGIYTFKSMRCILAYIHSNQTNWPWQYKTPACIIIITININQALYRTTISRPVKKMSYSLPVSLTHACSCPKCS